MKIREKKPFHDSIYICVTATLDNALPFTDVFFNIRSKYQRAASLSADLNVASEHFSPCPSRENLFEEAYPFKDVQES